MNKRLLLLPILLSLLLPLSSPAATVVAVGFAPPALPTYVQPVCPAPGYIWQPGYWAFNGSSYYWVSGVWVAPPQIGFYWTPGYWGFVNGLYVFNSGYWGPTVGFYGGINYGYGYYGSGYYGGRWAGNNFVYNTAVSRVNPAVIHNTYVDRSVARANAGRRVSFNGPGGASARPTAAQRATAQAHQTKVTDQMAAQAKTRQSQHATASSNVAGRQSAQTRAETRAANKNANLAAQRSAQTRAESRTTATHYSRATHNARQSTSTASRTSVQRTRQTHASSMTRHTSTPQGHVSRQTHSVRQTTHARATSQPRNVGRPNTHAQKSGQRAGPRVAKSGGSHKPAPQ